MIPLQKRDSLALFERIEAGIRKKAEVDLWTIADQVDHAIDSANDVDRAAVLAGKLT